jgi:hypothetical protein
MGIRLLCPNGHKLHIKAFLAGKRGICPKCGATFTIPSTIDQEADDLRVSAMSVPEVVGPSPSPEAQRHATHAGAPPITASQPAIPLPQVAPVVADQPALLAGPAVPIPPSSWNLERAAKLRYLINRQRQRRSQMVMTIWLLAAVILLAGLLVWVLTRKPAQTSALPREPRARLAEIGQPPYVAEASDSLPWEARRGGPMTV